MVILAIFIHGIVAFAADFVVLVMGRITILICDVVIFVCAILITSIFVNNPPAVSVIISGIDF